MGVAQIYGYHSGCRRNEDYRMLGLFWGLFRETTIRGGHRALV